MKGQAESPVQLWDDAQMDALSGEQLGILFENSSPRNHHQPTRSPSTFSPSNLCPPSRQVGRYTIPASPGPLPHRGGDGGGMLPSQISDSREGPGIHSMGSAGQALLHQKWLDPAKWPRKPGPGSLHLLQHCQLHVC